MPNAQDRPELPDIESLLAGIPLPSFVVDRDERILATNPLALELIGQNVLGRSLALFLRAPELLATIASVATDGSQRQITMRHVDDTQFDVLISPLPNPEGGQDVLCVLRDTTSEARHEEMRRDFVANVSHELRTPLTAMIGFIETLQSTAKDDPKARERFLDIMAAEAGRMNRLVRDLLHLSRVETQERMRPQEIVDLGALLTNAVATIRATAQEKGVVLRWEAPKDPLTLRGDADQLLQVFLNLVENAVKYGKQGGEVTVSVARKDGARGGMVQVAVTDQGEGIDPTHLPRLTERFYRVDNHRSRAEGGTGLGLAIVKHIVNRHRGSLRIKSRMGEGSTFTVSLPLD